MFTILGILFFVVVYVFVFISVDDNDINMGIAVIESIFGAVLIILGVLFNHPILLVGIPLLLLGAIHGVASDECETPLRLVVEFIEEIKGDAK
jgi:hypothetical protein